MTNKTECIRNFHEWDNGLRSLGGNIIYTCMKCGSHYWKLDENSMGKITNDNLTEKEFDNLDRGFKQNHPNSNLNSLNKLSRLMKNLFND